jgi:hypothetical protein
MLIGLVVTMILFMIGLVLVIKAIIAERQVNRMINEQTERHIRLTNMMNKVNIKL